MGRFVTRTPDGEGRALALVHGAGGDHKLWGEVLGKLRRGRIPAVAVDLPGHGRSPGPAPNTVAAGADALAAALAAAGIGEYVAVGHSLGGAVVLTLAARRCRGLRGLGLVSTGARLPVDPLILKGTLAAFDCTVDNLARYCFARGTPPEAVRRAADAMRAVGAVTLHADFTACSAYAITDAALAGLTCPTAVVCGDADVLTPLPLSQELSAKIPGAHLTVLSGCGHTPLLEAPEDLAAVLEALWRQAFPG